MRKGPIYKSISINGNYDNHKVEEDYDEEEVKI